MEITNDDVRKFQEIWQEEFKEKINEEEARYHIMRLDALYLVLYQPLRSDNGRSASRGVYKAEEVKDRS